MREYLQLDSTSWYTKGAVYHMQCTTVLGSTQICLHVEIYCSILYRLWKENGNVHVLISQDQGWCISFKII